MYSLGFFLTSIFYSFLISMKYLFYPNNYFILVLLLSSLILLVPIKINFKWLVLIYLSILMAMNLNISADMLNYLGSNRIFILIALFLISIFVGSIDSKGIIGIFSFFLFTILIIFIFIILGNVKGFEKPSFKADYSFLLIPFDLAILNIIRPKEVNRFLLPLGLSTMCLLFFLGQIITYSHFGNYIFDFDYPSIMIFKVQHIYDELGGYEFFLSYIIPILCVFRVSLSITIIKKLNINRIIPIILALLFLFIEPNLIILIILGSIIYLGGIYGHFRKIQE